MSIKLEDLSPEDLNVSPKMFRLLRALSNGLLSFSPADCDNMEPSEETIREYAESMDISPDQIDDDVREDVRYNMEYCEECGHEECPIIQMYRLIEKLKELGHGS